MTANTFLGLLWLMLMNCDDVTIEKSYSFVSIKIDYYRDMNKELRSDFVALMGIAGVNVDPEWGGFYSFEVEDMQFELTINK